jgi:predicted Holliday junction resolvase-like endonuclease
MKNDKKPQRFKKKRILSINTKRMLILIFIIIILIFILYLLKPKKKIKIKKQLKLENISITFNNSLKYEEFDEDINEQYIQLQNYFCEK